MLRFSEAIDWCPGVYFIIGFENVIAWYSNETMQSSQIELRHMIVSEMGCAKRIAV